MKSSAVRGGRSTCNFYCCLLSRWRRKSTANIVKRGIHFFHAAVCRTRHNYFRTYCDSVNL